MSADTSPLRMFVTLLLILFSSSLARAQDDERRVLNSKLVPLTGNSTEAFAPKGWVIQEQIEGDLNADGITDSALKLIEDLPPENEDGSRNTRHLALVVVFKGAEGKYTRAAVGAKLLYCSTCGGMLSDPTGGNVAIEISKGVLNVSQLSGSREATDLTQRFRYDARVKRFALIGEDVDNYDRGSGDSTVRSTNYLTGVEITRKLRVLKDGEEPKLVSTSKRKVASARRYLEDIDYEVR